MSKNDFEVIDINKILQCRQTEDAFIQRLAAYTKESRLKTKFSIHEYITKRKEYMDKRELNIETIGQLHNKSKEIESQLENILLQQKVIKKKLSNSTKIEEKLKEEIGEEKIKKENLTLEMVDLQQELDENKTKKKLEWNAINKACSIYKEYLNVHIRLKILEDHDCITVTFFKKIMSDDSNYYVIFSNYNTKWKVEQILPTLKDDELNKLNLHFSMDYDLQEIRLIICRIRNIFLQYLKHEN